MSIYVFTFIQKDTIDIRDIILLLYSFTSDLNQFLAEVYHIWVVFLIGISRNFGFESFTSRSTHGIASISIVQFCSRNSVLNDKFS